MIMKAEMYASKVTNLHFFILHLTILQQCLLENSLIILIKVYVIIRYYNIISYSH